MLNEMEDQFEQVILIDSDGCCFPSIPLHMMPRRHLMPQRGDAISELLSQGNQGIITGPHRHIVAGGHMRERLWRESVFPWMIFHNSLLSRWIVNDSLLTIGTIEQKTSVQPKRRGSEIDLCAKVIQR